MSDMVLQTLGWQWEKKGYAHLPLDISEGLKIIFSLTRPESAVEKAIMFDSVKIDPELPSYWMLSMTMHSVSSFILLH